MWHKVMGLYNTALWASITKLKKKERNNAFMIPNGFGWDPGQIKLPR